MKKNILISSSLLLISGALFLNGCKKDDTTAPVVTITGDNPATVIIGGTYTDAGATANDDVDGALTPTQTGTVDPTTEGTYYINYSATDKAGNTGTAKRTVNVVIVRNTYVGTFHVVGTIDGTSYTPYNTSISASSTVADKIIITNFGSFANSNVYATVSGHEVTIPSQTYVDMTFGTITVTGTGTMNNKGEIMSLTSQIAYTGGPSTIVETYTKQ